eukprot:TRINITY_DN19268_c0_g1_i1.p1 TRINITY_DN19268_c0_g1~~TRINITY_DN19268_c0_g1_i1.p1  ORF type:complete len:339 (+),score=79.71 TRINITY_DN19268_c0_g1_i1:35-1051(+)
MFFFFLMIRRPPRSTLSSSSAASDVYKRQVSTQSTGVQTTAEMPSFLRSAACVCVAGLVVLDKKVFAQGRSLAETNHLTWPLSDEAQLQVAALCVYVVSLLTLRVFGVKAGRAALSGREHILDMSALNDAVLFKEVFLAYLNAALLEPVLAIAGMEHSVGSQLITNLLMICSICWWIYIVTDAFDFVDVAQQFRYHGFEEQISQQPKKYGFLQVRAQEALRQQERNGLVGSVQRDVALWFLLGCIGAAWMPGVVTHRDVLHAYVIVFLWVLLHHQCRKATVWGSSYAVTFMLPSSALMPLEYCLPLQETFDCIEDLDGLEEWIEFIKKRTGVAIVIRV